MADSDSILGLPLLEHEAAFARVLAKMTGSASSPEVTIGRYQLVRRLGVGGMGIVYLVRDPDLDRLVALKLLHARLGHESGSDAFQRRMRREARAMARLDHPHVVRVLEVGEHDGRTYLVMEHVQGTTLSRWIDADEPWSWEQIVRVFVAAGRGLAAAHEAGLVHCDFKPDNVLMGEDGAIKVGDFGLVRGMEDGAGERGGTVRLAGTMGSGRTTRAGEVYGTPAYMAPEQLDGHRGDPRSDQFSFCVALYGALYGEAPFPWQSIEARREGILEGLSSPPAPARPLPGGLEQAIVRGLRADPEDRWPSMGALLEQLEHSLGARIRRRRRWVLGALATMVLVGVAVKGAERLGELRQLRACAAEGAVIDHGWNEAARESVRDGLASAGGAQAAFAVESVLPRLDRYADDWREARVEVCVTASLEGELDDETVARARWCLDARRQTFEALVAELSDADAATARNAVEAVTNLPFVVPCLDPAALESLPAPSEAEQARLVGLRAELAHVAALEAGGKYDEALTRSRGLLARIEDVGWLPLTAEARLQHTSLLQRTGGFEEAERQGTEAYSEASRARAWAVASDAAILVAHVVGHRQARYDAARGWSRSAETAELLAGDAEGLRRGYRLDVLGVVENGAGRHAEAKALHEESLALLERALGPDHLGLAHVLTNLANATKDLGDVREARALYERALAIRERTQGAGHPGTSGDLNNLAVVDWALGEPRRAVERMERVVELRQATLDPEHPDVLRARANLAVMHHELGRHEDAVRILEDLLPRYERALGREHPEVAGVTSNLGTGLKALGQTDRAVRMYARAVRMLEQALGPEHPNVAKGLSNLGLAQRELGRLEDARRSYERALAICEQALGPDHLAVARALVGSAEVAIDQGDAERARALVERALAIQEGKEEPRHYLAHASFVLARALVGEEPLRARRLAREAAAELRATEAGQDLRAEVDAWLEAQAGS